MVQMYGIVRRYCGWMGGRNKGQNYKVSTLIVVYSNSFIPGLHLATMQQQVFRSNYHGPSVWHCKGGMVAGWEEGPKDKIIR